MIYNFDFSFKVSPFFFFLAMNSDEEEVAAEEVDIVEAKYWRVVDAGNEAEVMSFLRDNPEVDVNWQDATNQ